MNFIWYGALVICTNSFSLTSPESSIVYIPSFRAVAPRVYFTSVPFLVVFFSLIPHTHTRVCRYNYVGQVFLEVLFLAFLGIHTKRKKCGQMGPTPAVKLCLHAKF